MIWYVVVSWNSEGPANKGIQNSLVGLLVKADAVSDLGRGSVTVMNPAFEQYMDLKTLRTCKI